MHYYFVYKTINLINGMYYIGKHKTTNINDGYIGSGTYFQCAVKKYGKKNFTREILCFCENDQQLFERERSYVSSDVVKDPLSYNLKIGGDGGWDFCNQSAEIKLARANTIRSQRDKFSIYLKAGLKKMIFKRRTDPEYNERISNKISKSLKNHYKKYTCKLKGRKLPQEHIQKIKESHCQINIYGKNNSMYEKIWIFNAELEQNLVWDKKYTIPYGWKIGRCTDFKKLKQKLLKESIKKEIRERNLSRKINKLYQMYNWYLRYSWPGVLKQFKLKTTQPYFIYCLNKYIPEYKNKIKQPGKMYSGKKEH